MNKLRKSDEIIVIAGKDKGKKGTITFVLDNAKVLVDGINMVKKHVKPNPNAGVIGGIVDKEMPMNISNIAILNPTTNKADRVGIRIDKDGVKERFFKSNNEVVDV